VVIPVRVVVVGGRVLDVELDVVEVDLGDAWSVAGNVGAVATTGLGPGAASLFGRAGAR
jgi:hypothetical protein